MWINWWSITWPLVGKRSEFRVWSWSWIRSTHIYDICQKTNLFGFWFAGALPSYPISLSLSLLHQYPAPSTANDQNTWSISEHFFPILFFPAHIYSYGCCFFNSTAIRKATRIINDLIGESFFHALSLKICHKGQLSHIYIFCEWLMMALFEELCRGAGGVEETGSPWEYSHWSLMTFNCIPISPLLPPIRFILSFYIFGNKLY